MVVLPEEISKRLKVVLNSLTDKFVINNEARFAAVQRAQKVADLFGARVCIAFDPLNAGGILQAKKEAYIGVSPHQIAGMRIPNEPR